MILRVDTPTARRLLDGEITQWRLPWRPWTPGDVNAGVRGSSPRVPRPSQVAPVHTGNVFEPAQGFVTIIAVHRADAHEASLNGHLEALGHDTLDDYVRAWLLRTDKAWLARRAPADETWATIDHAAEAALAVLDGDAAGHRWKQRWAGQPVWTVELRAGEDRPALLGRLPHISYVTREDGRHVIDDGIRDEDRGYYGDGVRPIPAHTEAADRGITHNPSQALTSAGEHIDPDTLSWYWRDDAEERHIEAKPRRTVIRRIRDQLGR